MLNSTYLKESQPAVAWPYINDYYAYDVQLPTFQVLVRVEIVILPTVDVQMHGKTPMHE